MVTKAPSYLTIRKGIYYFQLRIPAHINHSKIPVNRIIRKSTGTGNRREALRISRQWWNLIMAGDFFEKRYPELAKAENELNQHEAMVNHGHSILTQFKYAGIDENDIYAMNIFFEQYSSQDIECFYTAKEYYEGLQVKKGELLSAAVTTAPQTTSTLPVSSIAPSSLTLMDVFDRYVEYKTTVITDKTGWGASSKKKISPQIKILVEMVGKPLAHEFSKVMLRDLYLRRIITLPDRLNLKNEFFERKGRDENGKLKKIRKSIDECFEIADDLDLKRLDLNTVAGYVENTIAFIKWAAKNEYISAGIEVILEDLKDVGEDDERRRRFTEEELKILFETEEYQKGLLFDKPFRHWIPLISLYTGCRLGEAAQLYLVDIQESDVKWKDGETAWTFVFTNEGDEQTIKGKGKKKRQRFVPIHKDLVKLGLLNYWKQQKSNGEKQLFSGLSPDKDGSNWGRHLSRWFNGEYSNGKRIIGYKEKYGVVTNEERIITFHSFRHYVANRSKQNTDWNYNIWCEITGHSTGNTVRKKTYEDDFELDKKVVEMEKMNMGFIDIDLIKKWR